MAGPSRKDVVERQPTLAVHETEFLAEVHVFRTRLQDLGGRERKVVRSDCPDGSGPKEVPEDDPGSRQAFLRVGSREDFVEEKEDRPRARAVHHTFEPLQLRKKMGDSFLETVIDPHDRPRKQRPGAKLPGADRPTDERKDLVHTDGPEKGRLPGHVGARYEQERVAGGKLHVIPYACLRIKQWMAERSGADIASLI